MAAAPADILRRTRLLRGADAAGAPTLDGRGVAVFCDNDYLGLARDPRLAEAMLHAARAHGVGAAASPLITGYTQAHRALEERLAHYTGRERALVFASGFACNAGALGALARRGDAVLEDRLNHASLLDGARGSGAHCVRYRHADAADAEARAQEQPVRLIATDGVFSMDGDTAPVAALARIAQSAGAWLVCDDAHGLGVLGATGRGLLEEAGLGMPEAPVLTGTLGKAFGAQGGFVAGPADLVEEILQCARSYAYSTALAPPLAAAAECAVRIVMEEPQRLRRLQENIGHFRAAAAQAGVPLAASRSAIQPIMLGAARHALQAADALMRRGFAVRAIRPPTVPEGASRLRVTLSARHSRGQIEQLAQALRAALAGLPQIRGEAP